MFELVGGQPGLKQVTKIFYDKVYKHPWLSKFFAGIDQKHIEKQQAEFMQGVLGGTRIYKGKLPVPAHGHMRITEAAFNLRQELLRQSLLEARVDSTVMARWMALDEAFRNKLIKTHAQCKRRYADEPILDPLLSKIP